MENELRSAPIPNRRSVRLRDYDYTQIGAYFITICTSVRQCLFGDITNGTMVLSRAGKIVEVCWREIPQHFPHAEFSTFVVMPNHLHGIIVISVGTRHAVSATVSPAESKSEAFGKPVAGSVPTIHGERCSW
jgi:REP element-mobilizing transposase RayT